MCYYVYLLTIINTEKPPIADDTTTTIVDDDDDDINEAGGGGGDDDGGGGGRAVTLYGNDHFARVLAVSMCVSALLMRIGDECAVAPFDIDGGKCVACVSFAVIHVDHICLLLI